MGQHEASCNCEQNVPEWTSYHDSRWNDVATPVSCLCLPLQLLLSNLPGSHPRDSLDRNLSSSRHRWWCDSSNAHFLWPINNTMCHRSLRLCWHSRLSGLSCRHAHLPLRIHRVRSDFLSTEKWQFCTYLKGKQYVGLKKKWSSRCKDQLTQKTKFSEFVKHTYMPPMVPASLSLQEVLANSVEKNL